MVEVLTVALTVAPLEALMVPQAAPDHIKHIA
jgi:hypothetical protein